MPNNVRQKVRLEGDRAMIIHLCGAVEKHSLCQTVIPEPIEQVVDHSTSRRDWRDVNWGSKGDIHSVTNLHADTDFKNLSVLEFDCVSAWEGVFPVWQKLVDLGLHVRVEVTGELWDGKEFIWIDGQRVWERKQPIGEE